MAMNNNNNKAVIDSSALRALFYNEPGAEQVYKILDGACLSAVSLASLLGDIQKEGGNTELILKHLDTLALTICPFDYEQVCTATRHFFALSFECRAALALAISLNLPLYSANGALTKVELPIKLVIL